MMFQQAPPGAASVCAATLRTTYRSAVRGAPSRTHYAATYTSTAEPPATTVSTPVPPAAWAAEFPAARTCGPTPGAGRFPFQAESSAQHERR